MEDIFYTSINTISKKDNQTSLSVHNLIPVTFPYNQKGALKLAQKVFRHFSLLLIGSIKKNECL